MDIPPSPGCEQCACSHPMWFTHWETGARFVVNRCQVCFHTWAVPVAKNSYLKVGQ